MVDIRNKTAFVTGAAGGIGFHIARSLGLRGARVVMADIDRDAVLASSTVLAAEGIQTFPVSCDVADAERVTRAAAQTIERFGKVHIVVNNAGVRLSGKTGSIPLSDWRRIVDVNLMGVVHGVEIFTPLIRSHGEGGHIVNTASISGHIAHAEMGPYNATKFAIVGYTESIRQELSADGIGVSVLCPSSVAGETRPNSRNHTGQVQHEQHNASVLDPKLRGLGKFAHAADPAAIGEWVVDSMDANRAYIFTHAGMQGVIDERLAGITADLVACGSDPRFRPRRVN